MTVLTMTVARHQCPVCLRPNVTLRRYRDAYGDFRVACDDERSCFTAFAELPADVKRGMRHAQR